jgi:two-component system, OmpR family, response regulator
MRVLVVEDDVEMADLIQRGLVEEGFAVDVAPTGEDALTCARSSRYDAIILDVILPGIDGLVTCRRLREKAVTTPILMLTAKSTVADCVAGLDSGADDYLVKPFSFVELVARLRANWRRAPAPNELLNTADLRLDPLARTASRGDTKLLLSNREFDLLAALMRHPDEVIGRIELMEQVWHTVFADPTNIVEVYIGYLRRKVDEPFGVRSIETVRGAGYRIRKDGGR